MLGSLVITRRKLSMSRYVLFVLIRLLLMHAKLLLLHHVIINHISTCIYLLHSSHVGLLLKLKSVFHVRTLSLRQWGQMLSSLIGLSVHFRLTVEFRRWLYLAGLTDLLRWWLDEWINLIMAHPKNFLRVLCCLEPVLVSASHYLIRWAWTLREVTWVVEVKVRSLLIWLPYAHVHFNWGRGHLLECVVEELAWFRTYVVLVRYLHYMRLRLVVYIYLSCWRRRSKDLVRKDSLTLTRFLDFREHLRSSDGRLHFLFSDLSWNAGQLSLRLNRGQRSLCFLWRRRRHRSGLIFELYLRNFHLPYSIRGTIRLCGLINLQCGHRQIFLDCLSFVCAVSRYILELGLCVRYLGLTMSLSLNFVIDSYRLRLFKFRLLLLIDNRCWSLSLSWNILDLCERRDRYRINLLRFVCLVCCWGFDDLSVVL